MRESASRSEGERAGRAYPERLVGDIAAMLSGSLAYIGDRLGLFAKLAESGPLTGDALAQASGCHPRYIREWLAAMAVAGWIAHDPHKELYWLPAVHAPLLVEKGHPLYLGGLLETIVPLAEEARTVLDCFRHGGGISRADHHPDMPHILGRLDAPIIENYLTSVWLPELVPAAHQKLEAGAAVADVGCGTGRALAEMAKAYPKSSFTGYEPDERAARQARMMLIREGLSRRASVVQAGTEALAGCRYDFITVLNTIHKCVDPQAAVSDIYDALTATGICLFLERRWHNQLEGMQDELGRILYALSALYTLPVSLAHDGAGLGVCAGQELLQKMCSRSGFKQFRPLDFRQPLVAVYVAHK